MKKINWICATAAIAMTGSFSFGAEEVSTITPELRGLCGIATYIEGKNKKNQFCRVSFSRDPGYSGIPYSGSCATGISTRTEPAKYFSSTETDAFGFISTDTKVESKFDKKKGLTTFSYSSVSNDNNRPDYCKAGFEIELNQHGQPMTLKGKSYTGIRCLMRGASSKEMDCNVSKPDYILTVEQVSEARLRNQSIIEAKAYGTLETDLSLKKVEVTLKNKMKYTGIQVTAIRPGSAVDLLGFRKDDVVLRVGGFGRNFSQADLLNYIRNNGQIQGTFTQAIGSFTILRNEVVTQLSYVILERI